jgi:HEPN domain-containing protein
MNEQEYSREWLIIANDDLDSAQYLFARPFRKQLEIICYHCQQSAEKSLKAFLCASGIEPPITHQVGKLCKQCAEIDNSFSTFIEDSEDLAYYATRTRYPGKAEILEYHAQKAIRQAETIHNFTAEKLEKLFADAGIK